MFGGIGKALKKVAKSPFKTVSNLVKGDLDGAFNAAIPMIYPSSTLFGLDKMFV